ncbi:hypothetical protein BC829DRAFT_405914 [Chytridium lagenaria]|nr:hypothetical protein BC829DRAFT_405914 [Chytridium lagenaria]
MAFINAPLPANTASLQHPSCLPTTSSQLPSRLPTCSLNGSTTSFKKPFPASSPNLLAPRPYTSSTIPVDIRGTTLSASNTTHKSITIHPRSRINLPIHTFATHSLQRHPLQFLPHPFTTSANKHLPILLYPFAKAYIKACPLHAITLTCPVFTSISTIFTCPCNEAALKQ